MEPVELPKDKFIDFTVLVFLIAATVTLMELSFAGLEWLFLESEQDIGVYGMLGGVTAAFFYQRAKHMPASRNMMTNGSGQNYVFLMFLLIMSAIIAYPFISPGRESIVFGSGYLMGMATATIGYRSTILLAFGMYWFKYFRHMKEKESKEGDV